MTQIPIKQILREAKKNGIKQWQIADFLKINESQFSKSLRHEPDAEHRQQIMQAIEILATDNTKQ